MYATEQRKLQCLISNQLVDECKRSANDKLFMCSYRSLLYTMSQYESQSDESEDCRQFVMNILQSQADESITWLNYWRPFDTTTKPTHLQVLNLMLRYYQILTQ